MPSRRPIFAILAVLSLCAAPPRPASAADSVADARAQCYAEYGRKLAELAAWCDEQKLVEPARQVRAWLPRRTGDKTYLFDLDEVRRKSPPEAPAAGPQRELQRQFDSRFQSLRNEQADALFALAERAATERQPSLTLELVTEAARENLDFKPAWRLLGYIRNGGVWRTPFEVKQMATGKIWHPRFGWLPSAQVERYEQGERFYRNRWMTAEEEARLRRDIGEVWRVETDHYVVTTNHSLEEGVSLARRLERLHAIWQQLFAGYMLDDAELAQHMATGQPLRERDAPKHNVVYYRSRDEYIQALRPTEPQIGITLGIYFDKTRTAYFFAGDDQEPGTLYHEATHQLFHECRPVAKEVGRESNFWIIEAVACFMESLEEYPGYVTLGGAEEGRLPAARYRLLQDKFYMPLGELVGLGMPDLQRHANIAKLYSESAGLATFLLSKYPEPTVKYLEAVYAGHADRGTLSKLTGQSYAELDRQYQSYISSTERRKPRRQRRKEIESGSY